MHIKQVIIQGFKSYRERIVVEPFDKRHNVIVGRNGSGKSNFFCAIQFVLSDEFSHLRYDQRLGLLHEGSGSREISAYVEIIFDNSDNRILIEKDVIHLRRVIGSTKDQFILNKKVVSRSEALNLLENAGFSYSNPFYIVKQGKINEIATAPDSHRLKILKELAGIHVYDERKEKSAKILRETTETVKKIDVFLRTIEKRLITMEKEKGEFSQFVKWDRSRKVLEYIIHDTELKDNQKKLEETEKLRRESEHELQNFTKRVHEAKDHFQASKRKLKDAHKEVASIREQQDLLSTEPQQLLREKSKLDLAINDLTDDVNADNKSKEQAEMELEELKKTIAEKENELEVIKPKYEEMKKKEEECTRTLALNEQKRQKLYVKQERCKQFTSKKDRDKWIKKELKSLNKQIKNKKVHETKIRNDLEKDNMKLTDLRKRLAETTADMERQREAINEHNKEYYECKKFKDQTQSSRKLVTAGNRLFHHIVETDSVGTKILKEMNKQKLCGEVAFMPLNRLEVRDMIYPNDNNAIAMVNQLQYESKYSKAMKYIFGKTLICRNLDCATELRREYHLDCVTLDGDQLSSNGSLTSGYFNQSHSRLEMQKISSELMDKMKESEVELESLRKELYKTESNINVIVSEMQKAEMKQEKAKDIFDKVNADIRLMREELSLFERFRHPKEESLVQCRSSLEAMQATKEGFESELHQELMEQFTIADQMKVDELSIEIKKLSSENKEAFSARINLEATKNKLENVLSNFLFRRKDELVQALQEISCENRKLRLANSVADKEAAAKRIHSIMKDLEDADKKVQEAVKKEKQLELELEMCRNTEKEARNKMEEDAKGLEKIASKEVLIQEKIKQSIEKITALSVLPNAPELFLKYQKMSLNNLFEELEKVKRKLKVYTHVNKKASDQFLSLSEQKEKLYKRKEEIDMGGEKIKELIELLEHKRLDVVQQTFEKVSQNFTEIFKKLVPQGRGSLILRNANRGRIETGQELENADHLTGVGIEVSFTGSDAEMREINQLSGGQKSLVALTLIFAIQKCDPAPFYLFDEIDQELDTEHRKAIANIIHELSSSAQFITTTFRPELLENAHKFYGVKFRNKASHVECVSNVEAHDFLEDDAFNDLTSSSFYLLI